MSIFVKNELDQAPNLFITMGSDSRGTDRILQVGSADQSATVRTYTHGTARPVPLFGFTALQRLTAVAIPQLCPSDERTNGETFTIIVS